MLQHVPDPDAAAEVATGAWHHSVSGFVVCSSGARRSCCSGFVDPGTTGFVLTWILGPSISYCGRTAELDQGLRLGSSSDRDNRCRRAGVLVLDLLNLLGIMAFNSTWEIGGIHPSVTVKQFGTDLATGLNADSSKLAKSFGIAGDVVEVLLHSAEDRQSVWSHGALNLKPGIVRLQTRVKYFNPAIQRLTNAQIWVRFYNKQLGVLSSLHTYGSRKRHCVSHSVAKCKSVIGKAPPKVGSHGKNKEKKAPGSTQVYKLKQAPLLHIESTAPFVPITNTFEVLNTDVTLTPIEEIDLQQAAVLFNLDNIHREMGIDVLSSASNLGVAPSRAEFNIDVGKSLRITAESV
ncbi:hypothetical protein FNV43_RR00580 [Rhamnella rubrinervis]|uniref:Uncharacterized protein n=1 Tax=Rhamnella rubrinervis TaxID=2594499 RepID=A0A8K0HNA7_9ROSA|nr:hypothetical protein FNV43_RR00580 [Rhamnella rubrinervis]